MNDDWLSGDLAQALEHYPFSARVARRLSGGLINDTYLLGDPPTQFVLQRLHETFAPEINLTIEAVTSHLHARGLPTPRLLRTKQDALWATVGGRTWRVLSYVPGRSYASLQHDRVAYAAGRLLAQFHEAMRSFTQPLPCSRTSIHEPEHHFAVLDEALGTYPQHALALQVQGVRDAIWRLRAGLAALPDRPVRVLHGDPKIDNLLFDNNDRGICLIDLDTITEGSLLFDIGDALRSWCNTSGENAASPRFSADRFAAALRGYAEIGAGFLTPIESARIVDAVLLIYLELSARFAADALRETYFGWDARYYASRGEHNLARARNQLAAATQLLAQREAAHAVVARCFAG